MRVSCSYQRVNNPLSFSDYYHHRFNCRFLIIIGSTCLFLIHIEIRYPEFLFFQEVQYPGFLFLELKGQCAGNTTVIGASKLGASDVATTVNSFLSFRDKPQT